MKTETCVEQASCIGKIPLFVSERQTSRDEEKPAVGINLHSTEPFRWLFDVHEETASLYTGSRCVAHIGEFGKDRWVANIYVPLRTVLRFLGGTEEENVHAVPSLQAACRAVEDYFNIKPDAEMNRILHWTRISNDKNQI